MSEKYASIQVVRAVAILMVLSVHTASVTEHFPGPRPAIPAFATFGSAGVDLFFVVSGFIIALVTQDTRQTAARFVLKRVIRIVPFYWFFTAVWVAMSLAAGRRIGATPWEWAASFLILPLPHAPLLYVGWSLEHEVLFYGLVAALIATGLTRFIPHALALLCAAALAVHVAVPVLNDGRTIWDWHLASLYHFEFLLGVLIFRWRRSVAKLNGPLLLGAGAAAFPLISSLILPHFPDRHLPTQGSGLLGLCRVLSYGTASGLVVCGLLACEARTAAFGDRRPVRALAGVGDASYTLYLAHPLVFAAVGTTCGSLAAGRGLMWPAFLVACVAAVAFSVAWYRRVEAPAVRRLGRICAGGRTDQKLRAADPPQAASLGVAGNPV